MRMRLLRALVCLHCIALAAAGIAGFNAWISQAFPRSVRTLPSAANELRGAVPADHLLLDMNALLYKSTKKHGFDVEKDGRIVKQVMARVNSLLSIVRPRKSVVLAFDGPAPYSKVRLQRARRLEHPPVKGSSVDQMLITPGTTAMTMLTEAIVEQCAKRLSSKRYAQPTYFVSTSEFPGEGELKLWDWILTFVKNPERESIVLSGDDADLLLQCMAFTGFPNVRVLASIPKDVAMNYINGNGNGNGTNGNAPDTAKLGSRYRVMDRKTLFKDILQLVEVDEEVLAKDLVFLWALAGNDYLPKLRGLSIDALFESYVEAMNRLPRASRGLFPHKELRPDWRAMKTLFDVLSRQSQQFPRPSRVLNPVAVVEKSIQEKALPSMFMQVLNRASGKEGTFEFQARYLLAENNATMFESDWEPSDKAARHKVAEAVLFATPAINDEYLKTLHHAEVVNRLLPVNSTIPWEDSSPHKVQTYLSGILWTMKMYVEAKCPDTSYFYPWSVAPSPTDIADWIQQQLDSVTTGETSLQDVVVPTSDMPYLSPVAVAMAVLPWTNITDPRMFPRELHPAWRAVQEHLFDDPLLNTRDSPFGSVYKPALPSMSYSDVIARLDAIFQNITLAKHQPPALLKTSEPRKGQTLPVTSKEGYGGWFAVSRGSTLGNAFRMPRYPTISREVLPLQNGGMPATVWRIPAHATTKMHSHQSSFDPYASYERTSRPASTFMSGNGGSLRLNAAMATQRPVSRRPTRRLYAVRRFSSAH